MRFPAVLMNVLYFHYDSLSRQTFPPLPVIWHLSFLPDLCSDSTCDKQGKPLPNPPTVTPLDWSHVKPIINWKKKSHNFLSNCWFGFHQELSTGNLLFLLSFMVIRHLGARWTLYCSDRHMESFWLSLAQSFTFQTTIIWFLSLPQL